MDPGVPESVGGEAGAEAGETAVRGQGRGGDGEGGQGHHLHSPGLGAQAGAGEDTRARGAAARKQGLQGRRHNLPGVQSQVLQHDQWVRRKGNDESSSLQKH